MFLYFILFLGILLRGSHVESAAPCPDGWIVRRDSGYCYYVSSSDQHKSWSESRSACQSYGGNLLWISDLKEKEWFFNEITQFLMRDGSHQWWTGLNSRSGNKTLVWDDGLKFDNSILDETWLPGQPKFDNTNCGLIWSVVVTMKSCDDVNRYICKRHKDGTGSQTVALQTVTTTVPTITNGDCGPLWERSTVTGSCYQYAEEQLNWFDAKKFCTKQGGVLASISNPQEQFYLAEQIHTLPYVYLWLGLNDLNQEGGWEWIDHKPLVYINWSNGQPDNNGFGEDCGAIVTSSGFWSDFPCQNRTAFICKKSGENTPRTTPFAISKASTLPEGLVFGCGEYWTGYEDSCYQVLSEEYPWTVARDVCKSQEANLVSIENRVENDFIRGLMAMYNDSAWIGLNDIEIESEFKWVDDRSVSFTNWGKQQPNNLNGHENCVYINPQGGWMDYSCTKIMSYAICEKHISSTTQKDRHQTGGVVTKKQWISQSTTRTSSVKTRTVTTPTLSSIVLLHISPTAKVDGLTHSGVLALVSFVMVVSLVIFAFILYSCRLAKHGNHLEKRAGFTNPLYHGDFDEDNQIKVFTLASHKRVGVSISEENLNGGEVQTNSICVTVERIQGQTPEVTSPTDTSSLEASGPSVTAKIVQNDTKKTNDQKQCGEVSKTTSVMPLVTTPEVSEIRPGQILGINKELLNSYKTNLCSSETQGIMPANASQEPSENSEAILSGIQFQPESQPSETMNQS